MADAETTIPGVVAMYIDGDGHIWGSEACFVQECYSSFDLKRSQELRVKPRLQRQVLMNMCNHNVVRPLSEYAIQTIFSDLEKSGFALKYVYVGHDDD